MYVKKMFPLLEINIIFPYKEHFSINYSYLKGVF